MEELDKAGDKNENVAFFVNFCIREAISIDDSYSGSDEDGIENLKMYIDNWIEDMDEDKEVTKIIQYTFENIEKIYKDEAEQQELSHNISCRDYRAQYMKIFKIEKRKLDTLSEGPFSKEELIDTHDLILNSFNFEYHPKAETIKTCMNDYIKDNKNYLEKYRDISKEKIERINKDTKQFQFIIKNYKKIYEEVIEAFVYTKKKKRKR